MGGIKLGEIPVEDTTIYFIKEDEEPYVQKIQTIYYNINHTKNTQTIMAVNVKYELYIPNSSIIEKFEFN